MVESSGALGLVARREVRERLRSGGLWISTWLSLAAVVLAVAAPSLRGHDAAPLRLGAVGAVDAGLQRQLLALVTPADSLDLATLPTLVDEAQARAALRARDVDVVVVVATNRIITLDPVDRSATDRRTSLVYAVESVLASAAAFQAAGLSAAAIAKVQASADAVTVEAVTSSTAVIDRSSRRTTAAIGAALIIVFSIVYGAWMVDGILEEKSSRVAELLLTAVRPAQLLRGKVVGVGMVALAQGLLLAAAAVGAATIFSSATSLRTDKLFVVGVLGWFLLGYGCYASAFALLAAVSRRHAEAQGAALVVLAPLLSAAALVVPALVGQRPDRLLRVLSVLPFTSVVAMPVRQSLERVPTLDLTVAVAGLAATVALLVAIAGRAYGRSVLDPTRPWFAGRHRRSPGSSPT